VAKEATPESKERRSAAPIDPRLVRRARATRTYMISGVVVGSLTAVLVLSQAKLLSSSIASVFATHTLNGLGLTLGLLVAVLIGRGVLAWASSWLAQRTSSAVKSQLRRDILAARMASPAHQTSSSSSLVTLVTQGLDSLDGYFSKYLPQLLLAVTVPVIVGAAILFSDWRSALIIAATIPFIPLLMALVGWTTEKQVSKRWAFQSRLASHFADLVSGLPTLQVFGRAKAQAEGLRRTENANRRETMAILRISFLSAFVLELFSTLAVAVIALVIGTRLVYGHMDFSTALFVLILAPEVYLPIRQVGVHYHDSADGLAAAEAAFAEIDRAGTPEGSTGVPQDGTRTPDGRAGNRPAATMVQGRTPSLAGARTVGSAPENRQFAPPEKSGGRELRITGPDLDSSCPRDGEIDSSCPRDGETDSSCPRDGDAYPPSIEIRGLTYVYPGSDTAVGPFTLDVHQGEIVALAGRSGGGKTTLLNCVLGFLTPTTSDDPSTPEPIRLGGIDARHIDWARWRAGTAYVPQVPGMVDGTIADNVRMGCAEATDDQVRQVLAAAGAANLDPGRSVGEEGEGLSVGERRRVGIARALARIEIGGARLLILDEPTAGLDIDTEATVLASLKESGATALIVSHREAVLKYADRVVEIATKEDPTPQTGHTPTKPIPAEEGHPQDTTHTTTTTTPTSQATSPAKVTRPQGDTSLIVDKPAKAATDATEQSPTRENDAPATQGNGDSRVTTDNGNRSESPAPAGGATQDRRGVRQDAPRTPGEDPARQGRPTMQSPDNEQPTKQTHPQNKDGEADDTTHSNTDSTLRTKSPLLKLVFQLLDSVPKAKSRLFWAVIFAACASGAAVSLMGVSAWLISKAAQHPPFLELSVAAVGVRFFGISRGVFRYVERLIGHDVALSMQSALRLKTYQALSRTTLLGRRQGDLLVRVVADVGAIEDIVVRIVQPFLAASIVVVGVCAILARFSVAAALTVLASAILGGLVVPWMTQRVSLKADERAIPLRGDLGVVAHNLSRNAVDLAAYGAQERGLARLASVDAALRETEEAAAWAKGIGAGLQTIASGIGFIGGLWIGSVAVANGLMGERLLAVMVMAPLALHEVFATFSQAAQTWTRAKVALTRVTAILDAPPVGHGDVDQRQASETPSLTCQDLEIGWPGHPPVAQGLTLAVAPGEAVGVMGPSGVGKTTLAATVMGLIPPVAGELATSGRIGYLAQDAHIFTTTIAENVRIGNKDATDDEVRAALAEAGLDMPLDREVGEMGVGLSGGEARRLALARLFAGDYRLLILDEPTEHLDRETAEQLMDEIIDGVARRPVLVISHDETIAARCDRVLTMDERSE